MTNFDKSLIYAIKMHDGQYRKGTKIPYWVHPVAAAKKAYNDDWPDELCCAIALHDVVEDTDATDKNIRDEFGETVANIVKDMTDVYTKANYPNLTRSERKSRECERIGNISTLSKIGKMFDIDDNVNSSYSTLDLDWRIMWLNEKLEVMHVISSTEPYFAYHLIERIKEQINDIGNIRK